MIIYAVNVRYSDAVSHDFEPTAFFSERATAERYRDHLDAKQAQHLIERAEYYQTSTKPDYTFDVEEWILDDPDILAVMGGT